ncbi:MAG: DUF4623 domain-containing protein [Candidatus Kryptonium sp.]|nr:DUF4623 domain-containing protein [Candidatus Kryptonium sp.]
MWRKVKNLGLLLTLIVVISSIAFAQLTLRPVWVKKAGEVSWLRTDNNTRGMAYNPANDRIYVVSRSVGLNVIILSGANGDSLGRLDVTGITGGTFPLNMIDVSDDGVIYACNLSTNSGGDTVFKVYRWASETSTPTVAVTWRVTARVGDAFAVVGSGTNTKIYASGTGNANVIVFGTTDGVNFTYERAINVGAGRARLGIDVDEAGNVWGNGAGTLAGVWDQNGTLLGEIPGTSGMATADLAKTASGRRLFFTLGMGAGVSGPYFKFYVYDVTDGPARARLIGVSDSITGNSNANATGRAVYDPARHRMIALATNNYLASFQLPSQIVFNVNTATSPKFLVDTSLVEVRGSHPLLGPWGSAPTNRMRNLGGDYWQLAVDFPDTMIGRTLEYKFYAEDWEDGPNYSLTIPPKDTVLPLVFFRKQGFGPQPPYTPTDSIDVWFRVYVYGIPEFDPARHVVGVRGARLPGHTDFGDISWGRTFVLRAEPANDRVWSGRLRFPSPSAIAYKFVIAYKDSPNVVVRWESDPNREVTINRDTTLRWTTFDRRVIAPAKPVALYFSVDMSVMQGARIFFPDSGDVVLVRGTFNGWGERDSLAPSILEPGIWEKFVTITAAPGDFIEFKYYIKTGTNNQARVPNAGWETGANRRYVFTDADTQEVPRDYFNKLGPEGYVQKEQGVEVWFYCDMRGATDKNGDRITRIDSLFIAGSTPPLFWIWDQPTRDRSHLRMYDDGRYPDKIAGDSIYSVALTFPKWSIKGPIQFKFAVNGPVDNEAGFQEDHLLFLDDMPNQPGKKAINELEVVKFGRQRGLGAFKDTVRIVNKFTGVKQTDEVPLTYALYQNYPNPFNPITTIKYSIPRTEKVTLKIYNILGQEVATLIDEEQKAGVYEFKFDASNLASGVYFYRLTAGSFVDVKKMMLVK